MKKILFLFAALWLAAIGHGQEKIIEYTITGELPYTLLGGTVHGNSKNDIAYFHTILVTRKNIQHIYAKPDGSSKTIHVITQETEPTDSLFKDAEAAKHLIQLYRKSRLITHIAGTQKVTDLLYRAATNKYYFIETDIVSGAAVITDTIQRRVNAELMTTTLANGSVYMLHHIQNTDLLTVTERKTAGHVRTDTIRYTPSGWTKQSGLGNLLRLGDQPVVGFIPINNNWIPPFLLDYEYLAFEKKGLLTMLVSKRNESDARIIRVHIPERRLEEIKINLPVETGYNKKPALWITDSLLIAGYTTEKHLRLFIYNQQDGALRREIKITADNFSQFTSSEIIKWGNFWSRSNIETIRFNEFLKKATSNQLIITGHTFNGELFLTLASKYDLFITAPVLANILSLWSMEFSQSKPPMTVSFDLNFRLPDLKSSATKNGGFVWEKILMFLLGNGTNYLLMFTGQTDYYYVGQFNPDTRKLKVLRFYKYL